MSNQYAAADIEVLAGLDPVRKRPGMYTDTTRPNHLVQEVVDNSVDEAIAGHASRIEVRLRADGFIEVVDDGRGMPVDIHPEEGVSGVEVILTKLHAGGKFSSKNYQFSGGLHGVGVSVVNALSASLQVEVRRAGKVHHMAFAQGEKTTELEVTGKVAKATTGTTIRFQPEPKYFDSPKVSLAPLKHLLKAKAVLCPGLVVILDDEANEERIEWRFEPGLDNYLAQRLNEFECLLVAPYADAVESEDGSVAWAVQWLPEEADGVAESYVNLVPTAQGGTHVNGLRQGLLEAIREFCDWRNLLPRGVKVVADDVFDRCAYVLSVKLQEPQFSGQTKERLSSRECASMVSGAVRERFTAWLHGHVESGERLAQFVIERAQARTRDSKKVVRKKTGSGPALPGKLADCTAQDLNRTELFLVEGDSAGGSAKQARDKEFQAIMPLRGKILNTWEVASGEVLASQEVHDISVAIGAEPGSDDISGLRYGKICILADADSDGAHIATLLCALFVRHFRPVVAAGHVFAAMPPLYRIDHGKEVRYALDEAEKDDLLKKLAKENAKARSNVQRFKGLGEMNPDQLRETTIDPATRRLVQLTLEEPQATDSLLTMLLGRKHAADRRGWLERNGNLATPL